MASSIDRRLGEPARERALLTLQQHFASDHIDLEEYERRVEAVEAATLQSQADQALLGLPELTAKSLAAIEHPDEIHVPALPVRMTEAPATSWSVAIMGGVDRKGAWPVPRRMFAVALCGGIELDFREAQFAAGVHQLIVYATWGGVNLIVPPGLIVDVDGIGIMGGFTEEVGVGPARRPEIPSLRVTGLALMGGVSVEERLPGESGREARRRRKAEAKVLKARAARKRLPAAGGT